MSNYPPPVRAIAADAPRVRNMRITDVALRYDELLELLYRAYRAGQSDERDRNERFARVSSGE